MASAISYGRQSDQNNEIKLNEDDDDSLSNAAQLAACDSAAEKAGDRIVAKFSEQFTGTTDTRPEFNRLRDFVTQNAKLYPLDHKERIRRLYIFNYKRLSRDPMHTVQIIRWFDAKGVEVVPSYGPKFGTGPLDQMILFTLGTMGQMEILDNVSIANGTRRRLADEGKLVCSGSARFGYAYDKKARTRVIDPEAAPIVERILTSLAKGMPLRSLALALTQDGVPTPLAYRQAKKTGKAPRHEKWVIKTLRTLVYDRSYSGEAFKIGKAQIIDGDGAGRYRNGSKKRTVGLGTQEVGEATPAIVSKAIQDKAIENCKNRSKPQVRHDHWLIGFVYCAACNRNMVRCKHNRGNYTFWRCNNYQFDRSCPIRLGHVHNKHVEDLVWQRLVKLISDKGRFEAKLRELEEKLCDPVWENEATTHEKEIKRLKAKVKALVSAFAEETNPIIKEAKESTLKETADQIEYHEKMVVSLAEKLAQSRQAKSYVDGLRQTIADRVRLRSELSHEEKAQIAKAIGLRVILGRRSGELTVDLRAFDYDASAMVRSHLAGPKDPFDRPTKGSRKPGVGSDPSTDGYPSRAP